MSINMSGYRVIWEDYTDRHYVKYFEKNYKGAWATTKKALDAIFENIDRAVDSGRTEPPVHIADNRSEMIIKTKILIAGLKEGRAKSSRQAILYVNNDTKEVNVLLIYEKKHIGTNGYPGSSETTWWEQTIKYEYKEIVKNLSL